MTTACRTPGRGRLRPRLPGRRADRGADPPDAEAVRRFATGRLPHYTIPRYVMVVDEFPMTVTGKVRKIEMREEAARRLGLG